MCSGVSDVSAKCTIRLRRCTDDTDITTVHLHLFDPVQMMQTDVIAHKPGLEEVLRQADEISHNNTDTRVAAYAQQLNNRYKNVATSVKVSVKDADILVQNCSFSF